MRFFIFFLILLLTSCNDNKTETSQQIYKHFEVGTFKHLDPVKCSSSAANKIIIAVYDTLYEYEYTQRPYQLKPNLAQGMPKVSNDGLTYIISLKKDVYFIDDPVFRAKKEEKREVVANDFVYSIKRHFDPKNHSQGSYLWKNKIVGLDEWQKDPDYDKEIEGLKAIDSHTIQIILKKPYPQLTHTFTSGFSAIVSHEIVNAYKQLDTVIVGSGPFILKSFNTKRVILSKNKSYREEFFQTQNMEKKITRKLPLIDTIEVYFGSEQQNWKIFNNSNNYHFVKVPAQEVPKILAQKSPLKLKQKYANKYTVHLQKKQGFVYATFNMSHPQFGMNEDAQQNKKNISLRRAIIKAFNWQKHIETLYNNLGSSFYGIIPPHISGQESSKTYLKQDIEGAKKLLSDAGFTSKNLPVFTYPILDTPQGNTLFEIMRQSLLKIGYPKEKIQKNIFSNFANLTKSLKNKQNTFYLYGWGFDYPDSINSMQLFYGPSLYNMSHFNNASYNKLYEKAAVSTDEKEKTKLYRKMNNLLTENAVGTFGFSPTEVYLSSKKIEIVPGFNYFKYIYKLPENTNKENTKPQNDKKKLKELKTENVKKSIENSEQQIKKSQDSDKTSNDSE